TKIGSGAVPVRFRVARREVQHRRHVRKYAEGELPPDRSFYFRGPQAALNLRAANLKRFCELVEGVDEATWAHHLKRGDYSAWMRRSAIAAASRAQRSSLARNTPGAARRPASGPPSTKASRQSITLSAGRHARLASAIIAR